VLPLRVEIEGISRVEAKGDLRGTAGSADWNLKTSPALPNVRGSAPNTPRLPGGAITIPSRKNVKFGVQASTGLFRDCPTSCGKSSSRTLQALCSPRRHRSSCRSHCLNRKFKL